MTDPHRSDDRPHTTINNVTPERSGGGGGAGTALLVGAIVVVLAIVAWFVFAGGGAIEAPTKDVNVDVSLPEAPSAPAS